jgi:hypothetical protein
MTATIKKDTREEAVYVGAFLRAVGFLVFIISVLGGIVLLANSEPLTGFYLFASGLVSAAGCYGIGLLLKMGVERD